MSEQLGELPHRRSRASRLAFWLCIAGVGALSAFWVFTPIRHTHANPKWLMSIFEEHFAATAGLPLAMVAALVVVTLFRYQAGPIQFEVIGLKLSGAGGPIVMWVIVFLSMAFAIKFLGGCPRIRSRKFCPQYTVLLFRCDHNIVCSIFWILYSRTAS